MTVSAKLNHNRSLWVLDSDKGVCQARNEGGEAPLEKCVGHSLKLLDIV